MWLKHLYTSGVCARQKMLLLLLVVHSLKFKPSFFFQFPLFCFLLIYLTDLPFFFFYGPPTVWQEWHRHCVVARTHLCEFVWAAGVDAAVKVPFFYFWPRTGRRLSLSHSRPKGHTARPSCSSLEFVWRTMARITVNNIMSVFISPFHEQVFFSFSLFFFFFFFLFSVYFNAK